VSRRSPSRSPRSRPRALWRAHDALLRDPRQIVAQWWDAAAPQPELLAQRVRGAFWDVLKEAGGTLFVSREYEHLLLCLRAEKGGGRVSWLRLPHPSGLAVDERRGRLHVASTRNPNVLFEFAPATGFLGEEPGDETLRGALLPVSARYLPGRLYLHDLAFVGGALHGSACGINAIVRFPEAGGFRPVWWPRSIDAPAGPRFDRNYLQLNSIAAGRTLKESFFSASAAVPSARRPGQRNFPVDGRGVLFSGRNRDVVATGLTRPHSARLHGGRVWVANSGYGELGVVAGDRFEALARLPGWTRGLACRGGVAFVGTSRVIPRFRSYAPGLDEDKSRTGVHAVDLRTGRVLGSLFWPGGNQIFAVELAGALKTTGFPPASKGQAGGERLRRFHFGGLASQVLP